jgi:hypothetical protein
VSTAVRRLGLAVHRAVRDSSRPVVVLFGLRPGAGVTSLAVALRRTLVAEGHTVRVVDGDVLAMAPALDGGAAMTIVDGGAVLSGRGPGLDPRWRPLLAGVVVVVCAERDVAADADETAALLAAMELPVIGVVWSGIAAPPPGAMLDGCRRRARSLKGTFSAAADRLRRLLSPGAPR